ncbi:hypothetical protein BGZ94_000935 [Podila epigama]|nr:hypothetical protein BGZ94_000935 [Podila epigama]
MAAEHHHSLPACCSLYALYTSTRNEPGLVRSDTKAAQILIHALRIWTARRWSTSRLLDSDHEEENDGDAAMTGSPSTMTTATFAAAESRRRSKIKDDHNELEEYFAHSKPWSSSRGLHGSSSRSRNSSGAHDQMQQRQKQQGRREGIRKGTTGQNIPIRSQRQLSTVFGKSPSESVYSEYRTTGSFLHPSVGHSSEITFDNQKEHREYPCQSTRDDVQNESGKDSDYDNDDDADEMFDEEESYEDSCDEREDEEHAKEEEARRIGLATSEVEDIVQKMCAMIQKGVLALDEPVVVEAVAMLRKIERGLSREAEAWKQHLERSKSLFESSLSGGNLPLKENLLLTQGVDLSMLNLSPIAQQDEHTMPQKSTALSGQMTRTTVPPCVSSKQNPANWSIQNKPAREQEVDRAMCRAIRIRVLFTLGWVHQRMGKYHLGAQAYGLCSEITPKTGKRPLDSMQQEATVQKFTCRAFEKKALEQAQKEEAERKEQQQHEQQLQQQQQKQRNHLDTQSEAVAIAVNCSGSTTKNVNPLPAPSRSSSTGPSSVTSQGIDISSPSSPSSSESSVLPSIHGPTISSLTAWSSGLFKLANRPKTGSVPGTKRQEDLYRQSSQPMLDQHHQKTLHNSHSSSLRRSRSVNTGLKINTLDALLVSAIEAKDKDSNRPHMQQRPSTPARSPTNNQQSSSTLLLTMTAHQTQVVKCGHCAEQRVLMPLCVCRKVRYCNQACRLADMEAHRKTGCHAALLGSVPDATSATVAVVSGAAI